MAARTAARSPAEQQNDRKNTRSPKMHQKKMTTDEIGHLISRLTKVNTAKAMKSRIFSADRIDYEKRYEEKSVLKNRDPEEKKNFPKMYPEFGKTADDEELEDIIEHVNKPTHSSAIRYNTEQHCPKLEVKRHKNEWITGPKSAKERDEIDQRLATPTFAYSQRKRDADFMRDKDNKAYYLMLPIRGLATKSFVRGGMRYRPN